MHVITQDGILWHPALPRPARQRHKLQGVRLAGPAPLPPARLVVQRKVSSRGGIQVAHQRIQVGFSNAGKTFSIDLSDTAMRIKPATGPAVLPAARYPVAVHRSQSRVLAALALLPRWRSAPPLNVFFPGKIPGALLGGRDQSRALPVNQPST